MVEFNCTSLLNTGDVQSATTSAHWCSEGDFRGTFTILSSCLSTLFITVWTSIHFDVPSHDRHELDFFGRRLKWLAIGLLAPELLLYIAWNQLVCAVKVLDVAQTTKFAMMPEASGSSCRERLRLAINWWILAALKWAIMPKAGLSNPHEHNSTTCQDTNDRCLSSPPQPREWTLTHSFYACMGGFVLDIPHDACPLPNAPVDLEQDPLSVTAEAIHSKHFDFDKPNTVSPGIDSYDNVCGRKVVTPAGFCYLLRAHPKLIPPVSAEHMSAMSKKDALGKILMVIQVSWFVLTCISRKAQDLPLSVLEVVTIVHAACTIFTALIWLHKPLNIAEPTSIFGTASQGRCAHPRPTCPTRTCLATVACETCLGFHADCELCESAGKVCMLMGIHSPRGREHFASLLGTTYMSENQSYAEQRRIQTIRRPTLYNEPDTAADSDSSFNIVALPGKFMEFLGKLVYGPHTTPWYYTSSRANRTKMEIRQRFANADGVHSSQFLEQDNGRLPLVRPVSSLSAQIMHSFYTPTRIAISMALAGAYGMLHLLAWNAHFPTHIESTIWRVATLVLCTWTLGHVVLIIFASIFVAVSAALDDRKIPHRSAPFYLFIKANIPEFIGSVAYLMASSALIVLSLRQLLFLQPAEYKVASWSAYFTHEG